MGTTTANMGLSKPTLAGDPGTWDDQINATIDLVDAHDHTTGKGVPVPSAGIGIDENLTMAGYSLTNVQAASFTVQVAPASSIANRSLYVRDNNDVYYRDASGTDHRWSSGGDLNLSLVGGIGGDYAAASALVYYDDTAEAYRFLEAAPLPNDWSRVACGDVDLYEHASGIANRVRLSSPAALAASYAMTFPAALPAAAIRPVYAGTTGALTFGHGDRVLVLLGMDAKFNSGWTIGAGGYISSTAGAPAQLTVPMVAGQRIKSLDIEVQGDGAADVTIDVYTTASGVPIGTLVVTNPAGGSFAVSTVNVTDTVVATGVFVLFTASAANISIRDVRVTYDEPA